MDLQFLLQSAFASIITLGISLFLPGLIATWALFPFHKLDWFERIPVGTAIALGLFFIPIVITRFWHLGWEQFLWIWIILVVILGVVAARRLRSPRGDASPSRGTPAPRFWIICFTLLLLLSGALTFLTPRDEDDWSYFWIVRRFADGIQFQGLQVDRYLLNVWWNLHSFVVRLTDVEVVRLGQEWMPFVFVPVSLLAFYTLARTLFRDQKLAIGATFVQVVFLLADLFNPDERIPWPGWWLFARLDQDHTLVIFLLLPIFAMLLFRYLEEGDLSWLASGALVQGGMISTHALLGFILSFLTVGSFGLVELVFARSQDRRRLAVLGIVMVAVFLGLFPFLGDVKSQNVFGSQFFNSADTNLPYSLYRYTFFAPTVYTLRVDFLTQPPALLMLILLPFLLPHLKSSATARFLLATTVSLLAVLYVPFLFRLFETRMGVTILRLWNWMPKALVVVFFLPSLWRTLVAGWQSLRRRQLNRQMAAAGLIVTVMGALVLLYPQYLRRDFPPALKLGQRLADGTYELLRAYRAKVHSNYGTVLAFREVTDAAPSYVPRIIPVLFREQPTSPERLDADQFYGLPLLTFNHLTILRKYNVEYIIVSASREIAHQLELFPENFELVYSNRYGMLFRVLPDNSEPSVIQANSDMVYGEWDTAIKEYASVIAENPEDARAHIGLGMIFELLDRPKASIAEFDKAARLVPDNAQVHYHLMRVYSRAGLNDKAKEHMQAAGKLAADSP